MILSWFLFSAFCTTCLYPCLSFQNNTQMSCLKHLWWAFVYPHHQGNCSCHCHCDVYTVLWSWDCDVPTFPGSVSLQSSFCWQEHSFSTSGCFAFYPNSPLVDDFIYVIRGEWHFTCSSSNIHTNFTYLLCYFL